MRERDERNEQKLHIVDIFKPLHEFPWDLLRRILHVVRHDE